MKRFTETNKWRDPWFRLLSSPAKQLWGYLTDNCDAVGIIEIDFKLVSDDCGQKINQGHIAELGDRVQCIGRNRYFLPKFIPFQYGQISDTCPAHKPVIRQIVIRGLVKNRIGYAYPSATLSSEGVPNQHNQYPIARVALPYRKGMERNGIDQGESVRGGSAIAQFDAFWNLYPKKTNRCDAEHAWSESNASSFVDQIMATLEVQVNSTDWRKNNGQYIPSPGNWLRDKRWNDEVKPHNSIISKDMDAMLEKAKRL